MLFLLTPQWQEIHFFNSPLLWAKGVDYYNAIIANVAKPHALVIDATVP